MADDSQNVGTGAELVYAGDTIRLSFTVTTGGTAAGVSAATYKITDIAPVDGPNGETLASKTLGSGITVSDGTTSGTVVAAVVLQPADTTDLSGDYHHQIELTASGDQNKVARGTIRLQPSV